MIAGLPWSAWVLLAFAVGTGLALELILYARARRAMAEPPRQRDS